MEGQLEASPSLGVGCHSFGIVLYLRRGNQTLQGRKAAGCLRGIKFAAHGADVGDGAPDLLRGHGQGKVVPGFQQNGLRLHQPLPDSAVGRLAKIAAFGVL